MTTQELRNLISAAEDGECPWAIVVDAADMMGAPTDKFSIHLGSFQGAKVCKYCSKYGGDLLAWTRERDAIAAMRVVSGL
jgi:hypothetical protein